MEQKPKVTRKDITITKGTIDVDCFVVHGVAHEIIRHDYIQNYLTHDDCNKCGKEFELKGRWISTCDSCAFSYKLEKYKAMPLVEWDGKSMLYCEYNEVYFDQFQCPIEWCEEEEVDPSSLMLVICEEIPFSFVNYEDIAPEVHEDWEPSDEMIAKLKEFNDWLSTQSTDSWFPAKQRVDLLN